VNNGIYTAYSGIKAQMDALEIASNNLANINSVGFKSDLTFYSALNKELSGSQSNESLGDTINRSVQAETAIDFTDGLMVSTGRDLDVAINGDGFLTVKTPQGIRYTRNGSMNIGAGAILSNPEGCPIIGISGEPITLGPGIVKIGDNGDVTLNGSYVDRLKVVTVEDQKKLSKEGSSLLIYRSDKEPQVLENATIRSGSLEKSNVSAISSMVRMVNIMRQFESIQKCINLEMNDMNSKSIEKLGR
jgi:flagellar basal-body rod protein FlgF